VNLRLVAACSAAIALSACAPPPPPPAPAPVALTDSSLCNLVQAEAAREPSLNVDRTPEVVKYDPRPLAPPKGGYPRGVIRRDGTTKVKVSVVVDTAGKPDLSTFSVVETTHPWLADNLKSLIPKWQFAPAYKNGCKVVGLWVFTAAPGQKPQPAAPVRKPATSTKPATSVPRKPPA
jgi:hypothetical protein